MFTTEESWKMSEPEKVIALIQEIGCWRLGNWDGCVCSRFSVRNVDVEISCGKGREQGIWVSSYSMDYDKGSLLPIANEVAKQLAETSNRGGTFTQHVEAK